MNEGRSGRGWAALLGAGLIVLALLTVAIRTQVVNESHELLERELLRLSLERRITDLEQQLQGRWHLLGEQIVGRDARDP